MIREITFRGISVETGEWVYGYYGKLETMDGEKHFIITPAVTFTGSVSAYFTDHEVKPETVGQNTGNGAQIFEGDIVRFIYGEGPGVSSDGNDVVDAWFKEEVSEVTFSQGAFLIGKHLMWTLDGMGMDYSIEVIGNVYENPELLEDKQ